MRTLLRHQRAQPAFAFTVGGRGIDEIHTQIKRRLQQFFHLFVRRQIEWRRVLNIGISSELSGA
jgi:hypothetical protein